MVTYSTCQVKFVHSIVQIFCKLIDFFCLLVYQAIEKYLLKFPIHIMGRFHILVLLIFVMYLEGMLFHVH